MLVEAVVIVLAAIVFVGIILAVISAVISYLVDREMIWNELRALRKLITEEEPK